MHNLVYRTVYLLSWHFYLSNLPEKDLFIRGITAHDIVSLQYSMVLLGQSKSFLFALTLSISVSQLGDGCCFMFQNLGPRWLLIKFSPDLFIYLFFKKLHCYGQSRTMSTITLGFEASIKSLVGIKSIQSWLLLYKIIQLATILHMGISLLSVLMILQSYSGALPIWKLNN